MLQQSWGVYGVINQSAANMKMRSEAAKEGISIYNPNGFQNKRKMPTIIKHQPPT